jgi:hypothetical protein
MSTIKSDGIHSQWQCPLKPKTCFQAATTGHNFVSLMPACVFILVGNAIKFSCSKYHILIEMHGCFGQKCIYSKEQYAKCFMLNMLSNKMNWMYKDFAGKLINLFVLQS